MRQPPGTLESVAEELSTSSYSSSSSSSSRYSASSRPSVASSDSECQQRCFATASGAFCVAFSAGLALQVELARRLPVRLRGAISAIPAAAGIFAGVETYRFFSARCPMNRSRQRRAGVNNGSGEGNAASATSLRRWPGSASFETGAANLSGIFARRVSEFASTRRSGASPPPPPPPAASSASSTAHSFECAAASSASNCINSISQMPEERELIQQQQPQPQQQTLPQIPVWNHITETPTKNNSDHALNLIPGLP